MTRPIDPFALLTSNPKLTCIVLLEDTILFQSEAKGVKPLMDFYAQFGTSNSPLTVVDKIMGKSAVMLACLIGATTLYTPIISQDGLKFAKQKELNINIKQVVPFIINRDQSGRCPVESSVLEIDDIEIGYQTMINTLKVLSQK